MLGTQVAAVGAADQDPFEQVKVADPVAPSAALASVAISLKAENVASRFPEHVAAPTTHDFGLAGQGRSPATTTELGWATAAWFR